MTINFSPLHCHTSWNCLPLLAMVWLSTQLLPFSILLTLFCTPLFRKAAAFATLHILSPVCSPWHWRPAPTTQHKSGTCFYRNRCFREIDIFYNSLLRSVLTFCSPSGISITPKASASILSSLITLLDHSLFLSFRIISICLKPISNWTVPQTRHFRANVSFSFSWWPPKTASLTDSYELQQHSPSYQAENLKVIFNYECWQVSC